MSNQECKFIKFSKKDLDIISESYNRIIDMILDGTLPEIKCTSSSLGGPLTINSGKELLIREPSELSTSVFKWFRSKSVATVLDLKQILEVQDIEYSREILELIVRTQSSLLLVCQDVNIILDADDVVNCCMKFAQSSKGYFSNVQTISDLKALQVAVIVLRKYVKYYTTTNGFSGYMNPTETFNNLKKITTDELAAIMLYSLGYGDRIVEYFSGKKVPFGSAFIRKSNIQQIDDKTFSHFIGRCGGITNKHNDILKFFKMVKYSNKELASIVLENGNIPPSLIMDFYYVVRKAHIATDKPCIYKCKILYTTNRAKELLTYLLSIGYEYDDAKYICEKTTNTEFINLSDKEKEAVNKFESYRIILKYYKMNFIDRGSIDDFVNIVQRYNYTELKNLYGFNTTIPSTVKNASIGEYGGIPVRELTPIPIDNLIEDAYNMTILEIQDKYKVSIRIIERELKRMKAIPSQYEYSWEECRPPTDTGVVAGICQINKNSKRRKHG